MLGKKTLHYCISPSFAFTDSVTFPSQLISQGLHFLVYGFGIIILSYKVISIQGDKTFKYLAKFLESNKFSINFTSQISKVTFILKFIYQNKCMKISLHKKAKKLTNYL